MNDLIQPLEHLAELIREKDNVRVAQFINDPNPSKAARVISRLSNDDQMLLFSLLSPENAAGVIEDIPEAQAADLVEEMSSEEAAAILEELPGDRLVNLLDEMDGKSSRAVLAKMDLEDAKEARNQTYGKFKSIPLNFVNIQYVLNISL